MYQSSRQQSAGLTLLRNSPCYASSGIQSSSSFSRGTYLNSAAQTRRLKAGMSITTSKRAPADSLATNSQANGCPNARRLDPIDLNFFAIDSLETSPFCGDRSMGKLSITGMLRGYSGSAGTTPTLRDDCAGEEFGRRGLNVTNHVVVKMVLSMEKTLNPA